MFNAVLLQAEGGAPAGQMILLVGMLAVFYIFMILPQQRKQKKQRKFVEELGKGDQVVTASGMHGKIVAMDEQTVTLEVDRGIKIKFERVSISMENSQLLNADKKEVKEEVKS